MGAAASCSCPFESHASDATSQQKRSFHCIDPPCLSRVPSCYQHSQTFTGLIRTHQKMDAGDTAKSDAIPEFAAIFLDGPSKQALLTACPAMHKQLHADHVTLLYKPQRSQLAQLRVGSEIALTLLSEHSDTTCHAVCIQVSPC